MEIFWASGSYPNDSEKLMLASQTGLTKNQVKFLFSLWQKLIRILMGLNFLYGKFLL